MRNLAIATALLLASGSVQAATLVIGGDANPFASTNAVWGDGYRQTARLPQFDSSLGRLTGVDVSVTTTWENYYLAVTWNNTGNPNPEVGPHQLLSDFSGNVVSTLGPVNIATAFSEQGDFSFTGYTKNFKLGLYTSQGGASASPTNLSQFIGSGFVQGDFSSIIDPKFTFTGPNDVYDIFPQYMFTLNSFYTVTYTYDESAAAVPEPTTWAMMLAGFGLVGAAARRRRKAMAIG